MANKADIPPENAVISTGHASEELVSVTLLLDFYGELLTDRQGEVLAMHYNDDLSLAEIAQELGISRQAAHDAIQTGKTLLHRYEEKLRLVERFSRQRELVREAKALIGEAMVSHDNALYRQKLAQSASLLGTLLEQL